MTQLSPPTKCYSNSLDKQTALKSFNIIICSNNKDGMSTLINQLDYEAQPSISSSTVAHQNFSSLKGEESSGIRKNTKSAPYHFINTPQRKFTFIAPTELEQYIKDMVAGVSQADLAVMIIDAPKGLLSQTRRYSTICSTLGIKNVVLAINKMDLVEYSLDIFNQIDDEFRTFANKLSFDTITTIPLSALHGFNITTRAPEMQWYHGPTLLHFLETIEETRPAHTSPLRFPVQCVNQTDSGFLGYSGSLVAGQAFIGQPVRILPSGETTRIKEILFFKDKLEKAESGKAVTVTLQHDFDVSRGDIIVAADSPCEISDQFEIQLIWLEHESGYLGRSYWMKIGTQMVNTQITDIKYKVNPNTFEKLSASEIELNDLCVVTIKTDKAIPFEPYKKCAALGSLILIDKMTNQTVAAGMIEFSLRRASNVHRQKLDVDIHARRRMNGHSSKVLWFTGLSGSGKSTIANALEKELHSQGIRTYILDGDNVRHGLNQDLGFTDADRVENIRRISEVAKLMLEAGIVVLTAFISPFRAERQMARELFKDEDFIEIFVDTPLEIAELRDPKGLYKKARRGEIPNFTGINSPYEPPINPEITVSTAEETVDVIVKKLINRLEFHA